MSEFGVRVTLVGGSELTRDLFAHVLGQAGIDLGAAPDTNEPAVTLLIADDDEPSDLLADQAVAGQRSVIVSDMDPNDPAVAELVLEGADAVIGLHASAQELAEVIKVVAGGGTVIAPAIARRVSEVAREHHAAPSFAERTLLTNRELDILQSIERGDSVKETAASLGITAKTVENLQSKLFRKLEVRNRAQAFAKAHAMNLLPEVRAPASSSPTAQ